MTRPTKKRPVGLCRLLSSCCSRPFMEFGFLGPTTPGPARPFLSAVPTKPMPAPGNPGSGNAHSSLRKPRLSGFRRWTLDLRF